MVWLTMVVSGVYPAGWRLEVDDEQILPGGDHLSLYLLSPKLVLLMLCLGSGSDLVSSLDGHGPPFIG